MTLPTRIILTDLWAPLVSAWSEAFAEFPQVEVHAGDFFDCDADALLSPANSFGIMDGGLDATIRAKLGGKIESRVQKRIVERHHGELPIGAAEIVRSSMLGGCDSSSARTSRPGRRRLAGRSTITASSTPSRSTNR